MKINKTDNCARACRLHQGAICPAAVDFRTNITCQCHYLDKPPSLPVNILITSSPSVPERHPPPPSEKTPENSEVAADGLFLHYWRYRLSDGEERPFLRNRIRQRRWSERRRPPGNISGRPHSGLSRESHGVQQEDQTLLSSDDASAMFCSPSTESPNSSPQALAWPEQLFKSGPQSLKDQIVMVGNKRSREKKHFIFICLCEDLALLHASYAKRPQNSHKCTLALNYLIRNIFIYTDRWKSV